MASFIDYEMRHKVGCRRGRRPQLCTFCHEPAAFVDVVIKSQVTLKLDGTAVVSAAPSGTYVCRGCAEANP